MGALIEERAGSFLYDSDYETDVYSELLRAREADALGADGKEADGIFRREELLRR